jgi:hypothetical protein
MDWDESDDTDLKKEDLLDLSKFLVCFVVQILDSLVRKLFLFSL